VSRAAQRALAALALAAGVVAGATVGNGAAGTTTLTPVADAYVRGDKPKASFGKATSIIVRAHPVAVAYLRFRVGVPKGQAITGATLQLFAASRTTSGFTVHRVGSTGWGEATTTYANAPPIRPAAVVASGGFRAGAYVSVDVTPLVKRSGLVSLALKGVAGLPIRFASRESRTGRPRLVVKTAVPSVATTGGLTEPAGTVTVPTDTTPTTTAASGGGGGGGGGSGGTTTTTTTTPVLSGACGTASTPSPVEHVIWIWMENKPYEAVIGSSQAPFENQLATACGLATNYHGVSHPSLPNYVAATSGSTQGIADDEPPASHPLDVPSIYSQLKAVGKSWRDYEESSPGLCPLTSSGRYAVKHDPAPYYTGIRGDCASWDVPMGTTSGGSFLTDLTNGTLPAFSFVTPDLCNDTHDCSVATGDAWLQAWFAKIFASPNYRSGKTVAFVVWDEDDGSATNHIPLIVVASSTRPGTQSGTLFDHYALLKTAEQLLGITTFLGHAGGVSTSSMVSTFNLG
jgi:hypothetical protein